MNFEFKWLISLHPKKSKLTKESRNEPVQFNIINNKSGNDLFLCFFLFSKRQRIKPTFKDTLINLIVIISRLSEKYIDNGRVCKSEGKQVEAERECKVIR
jgi:hypothetical protein